MKRLLLLIIRTLIVIAIVFAFSRPTLRGYLPGAMASTAAVIIVDNSLSMRLSDDGRSLFNKGIVSASEIISTFKETDKIVILTAIGNLDNKDKQIWDKPNEINLELITESYESSDIAASINRALRILGTTESANKEIFIISDFNSGDLNNEVIKSETDEEVHIFFVETSSDEFNTSIFKIDLITKLLREGGNAQIEVSINTDNPSSENVSIDLFLEGTRVGQSTVAVVENNDSKIIFTVPIKSSGFLKGYAEINDDALIADNIRYFHLFVPPKIRILAIGSDEDLQFALLALKSYSSFGSKSPVKKINASETDRVITDDYDVIVLSAIPKNDNRFIQRLKSFISRGGGLLILPGGNFNIPEFNNNFAAELALPKIATIKENNEEVGGYLSIEFVDWNHPLFSGIFNSNDEKTNLAKFKKIYLLEEPNIGKDLIRLGGNIPLLKEIEFGAGHVIMMMSAPLLTWNDFPLKGLWVPFISRSIEYSMTGQESFSDTVRVGSELIFEITNSSVENNIEIIIPDGRVFSLQPTNIGNTIAAKFSESFTPGSYLLEVGDEEESIHTVNIDKNEMVSEENIERFAKLFSGYYLKVSSPSKIINEIDNSRLGIELWRYFAILAFILLVTEMALQRSYEVKEE